MDKELEEIREKYKDDNGLIRRLDIIERKLKVLEIIENKKVDVDVLKGSHRFEEYNIVIKTILKRKEEDFITKQEFDLLKEVLL